MAIYFVEETYNITDAEANFDFTIGNFSFEATPQTKVFRYGVYYTGLTTPTNDNDPLQVSIIMDSLTGDISNNLTATTFTASNVQSIGSTLTVNAYATDPNAINTATSVNVDKTLLSVNNGYEVILPTGQEIFDPNGFIIAADLLLPSSIDTSGADVTFKIFFTQ